MSGYLIRSRPPAGTAGTLNIVRDPDVLASRLEDAAHYPGGRTTALIIPTSEAEVAAALRASRKALPIGAQSSLTGGATPMGEILISTARLDRIESIDGNLVRVQAGVTLGELDEVLARKGLYYPPIPTFDGAFVGGAIATNASGAATFKYGSTRDWVEAITVVLPSGDVLDIQRGETLAHSDGFFEIQLPNNRVRIPVPTYFMPDVAKLSAGYFAEHEMDLIDLFIGAEGTLGIVTAATLRVETVRPSMCYLLIPFRQRHAAMDFAHRARQVTMETWDKGDPRGINVSGIEHMDARSLAIIREDQLDRRFGVALPPDSAMALLVMLELPPGVTTEQAFAQIGQAHEDFAPDSELARFCRLLSEHAVFDDAEIAVPGDAARADQLIAIREGVPTGVNARVGRAKQEDERISKTAGDVVVPFEQVEHMTIAIESEFARRGLDVAVWGHISDGNLHPNLIPRSYADVEAGRAAILAVGREAIRLGGAPLAEHGVGRNPIKQQLLKELYGEKGIEEMKAVRRAIDPEEKMSPGVLFPL